MRFDLTAALRMLSADASLRSQIAKRECLEDRYISLLSYLAFKEPAWSTFNSFLRVARLHPETGSLASTSLDRLEAASHSRALIDSTRCLVTSACSQWRRRSFSSTYSVISRVYEDRQHLLEYCSEGYLEQNERPRLLCILGAGSSRSISSRSMQAPQVGVIIYSSRSLRHEIWTP